jgi:hypothetical protein
MTIEREQFDDGLKVECSGVLIDRGALRATIGEGLFGLCLSDEFLAKVPFL